MSQVFRTTFESPYIVSVPVVRLLHHIGLDMPAYATPGAACLDLVAALPMDDHGYARPVVLRPGDASPIPTGIRVAIPVGWELQIRPRSGLATRKGIDVANSPATVDSDYRGELFVAVRNLGKEAFTITRGMRIAQATIAPTWRIEWREVHDLDTTERGAGGFGSTGI
jgi:dUTP pyrophosphatase